MVLWLRGLWAASGMRSSRFAALRSSHRLCIRSNIGNTPSINRRCVLEDPLCLIMHMILLGAVRIERRGGEAVELSNW
jgi:hypothetical protein